LAPGGPQSSDAWFANKLISTYSSIMHLQPQRLAVSAATIHRECFCLQAQRAARRLARLYDEGLRPFDLSHGQFSLLMLVAGHQPVSLGRLAIDLVMDRTTVTAAIKPLERRGLIVSTVPPADRRQRLLQVTDTGLALLNQASAAWLELQQRVAAHRPAANLRADLRHVAATAADPPAPRSRSTPTLDRP
jgi:DNA-binding MarR family transcriptional regulator